MRELQPDIAGYIASLGTTDKSLEICVSCQRTLIYGAVMYAGSVKAEVDRLVEAVNDSDSAKGVQALRAAVQHAGTLVEILATFVKADLIACLPGAQDLSAEDWAEAMSSFFQARAELYVSPEGQLVFEPHESGDEADADPEDGVPAA